MRPGTNSVVLNLPDKITFAIESERSETSEVAPDFRTAGLVGGSLLRMALNGAEHDEDTTED